MLRKRTSRRQSTSPTRVSCGCSGGDQAVGGEGKVRGVWQVRGFQRDDEEASVHLVMGWGLLLARLFM